MTLICGPLRSRHASDGVDIVACLSHGGKACYIEQDIDVGKEPFPSGNVGGDLWGRFSGTAAGILTTPNGCVRLVERVDNPGSSLGADWYVHLFDTSQRRSCRNEFPVARTPRNGSVAVWIVTSC